MVEQSAFASACENYCRRARSPRAASRHSIGKAPDCEAKKTCFAVHAAVPQFFPLHRYAAHTGHCLRNLQRAVSASSDPRRDGTLIRAIQAGACSEAANDSPKKHPPSAVTAVASERSSKALAQLLKLLDKTGAARLGQIWVPQPDINLSAQTGTALRPSAETSKGRDCGRDSLRSAFGARLLGGAPPEYECPDFQGISAGEQL